VPGKQAYQTLVYQNRGVSLNGMGNALLYREFSDIPHARSHCFIRPSWGVPERPGGKPPGEPGLARRTGAWCRSVRCYKMIQPAKNTGAGRERMKGPV